MANSRKPINQKQRAERAWALLIGRARTKPIVDMEYTYGELCHELGYHHRAAQWFLGIIQSYCHENRLPPLQALVVNAKTRIPGKGYDGSIRTKSQHMRDLKRIKTQNWESKVSF